MLKGWAPVDLLDTYEAERRPIGLHNVGRAESPGGARSSAEDALPWDLNGRIPHHWMNQAGARVSTIDLIGDGLTLFTAHGDAAWADRISETGFAAPADIVVLPPDVGAALGAETTGAVLVRPDGHEVARWAAPDALPRPGVAWLAP